jgi:hypothetical protein
MKNILKAIAFIACLMLPLSAMAMSAISDSDLSTMTGQSGVSINMNVDMNLSVATLAWGDSDGVTANNGVNNIGGVAANAGWVGLTALNATGIQVQLRTDLINAGTILNNATSAYLLAGGTAYNPANPALAATGGYNLTQLGTEAAGGNAKALAVFMDILPDGTINSIGSGDLTMAAAIKPLTIDVATDTAGTITGVAGLTFVRIGLGSLEISMASMTANVKLSHTSDLSNTNPAGPLNLQYNGLTPDGNALDNTMGQIYLGGLDVFINAGSYVDISAKGIATQGVLLGLNVIIDKLNIATLAWGDSDGIGTGTTAGWVGLTGLAITNLTVKGAVTIDVASAAEYWADTGNVTYVAFGLTNLAVGIGGLNAKVAMGGTTGTINQVLGSIYLSNLTATINGDVEIMAPEHGSGVIILLGGLGGLNGLSIAVSPFTVSWGEAAGFDSAAGYVGLTNFTITGLTLAGQVTIDVATVDLSVPAQLAATTQAEVMYAGYATHNVSNSFVHIGLGDGTGNLAGGNNLVVGIASLSANVVLDGTAALNSVSKGTLGMISATGIQATMNGWVDIAAH